MNVIDILKSHQGTAFSFELLPPLKGTGTQALFRTVERLLEYDPQYVNITSHRSEFVYKEVGEGLMQRLSVRRRPGSIAITAAIQQKFGLHVVPHLLCSGNTREDLEYKLIDLQFLDISDLLVLRGDKAREDRQFKPTGDGPSYATELIEQINKFNNGRFWDDSEIKVPGKPFQFGVACYPEKHEEAANLEADIAVLKEKVAMGAKYAVCQLFYDNALYFHFVELARQHNIKIPIIPGIKPLNKLSQLSMVPKTFHCDIPEALWREAGKCKTDDALKEVGVEWAIRQCRELMAHQVPSLHFYTVGAVDSVARIAKEIY